MSTRRGPLPPRHALPRDIVIPLVPGIGLSWYDHRGGYWLRRAGMSLIYAIATTLVVLMTVGFIGAAWTSSPVAGYLLTGLDAAYSLAIVAFMALRTARRWNDPLPGSVLARATASRPDRSPDGSGPGAAGLARRFLEQVFWAFSFLTIGLYLALFLSSLLPEPPLERRARLRVTAELQRRGYLFPES